MWWTRIRGSLLVLLAGTLIWTLTIAIDAAAEPGVAEQLQLDRERANRLEAIIRALESNRRLAEERADYPHNPKIIELYLAACEAEIEGNIEKTMVLLEEVHRLSEAERGESLFNVLRIDSSKIADRMFELVGRRPEYSYAEKIVQFDYFSRFGTASNRVQSRLLSTMLERMSYDAVLNYCEQRIADGDDYYRELRAVLRLLILQETIDRGGIEYHIQQVKKNSKPEDYGKRTFTEDFLREEAIQQYSAHYDPTIVEPVQVDHMISEMMEDPSRDAERIKRYCGLVVVAYNMCRGREDAVRSYLSHATGLIEGASTRFPRAETSIEREAAKNEMLLHVSEKIQEFERLASKNAQNHSTGDYGRMMDRESFVFEVSLVDRWEYARAMEKQGKKVHYLSYDDVFGQ